MPRVKILIALMLVFCFSSFAQQGWSKTAEEDHEHTGAETVWTCSMHPQIQLPEFGQCPICFMDLIEVVKDDGASRQSLRQITFDEQARRLSQVQVVPVFRGAAGIETTMVGKVNYDETRLGTITAWVAGRIDTLHVDYTGSQVTKGQPMAEIYSPELLSAQAELLQSVSAVKQYGSSSRALLKKSVERTEQAAREKLRLLGLTAAQIEAIIAKGTPADHMTLLAPMSGIVIKKNVFEGMYVKTGAPIYTIADLSHLWVELEAYESDLHGVSLGQHVSFQVEAFPGRLFDGQVAFVDPLVNDATRTIRVRLNVNNEQGLLKPGMFVRAQAREMAPVEGEKLPLLIPASAPLITGKRALVYVQLPEQPGVYVGKEVILGPRRGAYYEVKKGLDDGELVVTSGNFKIDSAIQLQARPSMMNPFLATNSQDPAELPPLFVSKLESLDMVFRRLSAAVHDESAETKRLLAAFDQRLRAIDETGLDKQQQLLWQELAMLLAGDVTLLQEAATSRERKQIYAAMAEHFHTLRSQYGLTESPAAGSSQASSEVQRALGALVQGYFRVQRALAADDVEAATQGAEDLTDLVATVMPLLEAERAASLQEASTKLWEARDLPGLRAAFYPLTQVLAQAVTDLGVTGVGPVYEQFCPMAFDNSGATWLADDEQINNPYFGAMMLRCGEVRKQLHDEL